jgi:hypothetical protein
MEARFDTTSLSAMVSDSLDLGKTHGAEAQTCIVAHVLSTEMGIPTGSPLLRT